MIFFVNFWICRGFCGLIELQLCTGGEVCMLNMSCPVVKHCVFCFVCFVLMFICVFGVITRNLLKESWTFTMFFLISFLVECYSLVW